MLLYSEAHLQNDMLLKTPPCRCYFLVEWVFTPHPVGNAHMLAICTLPTQAYC